LEVVLGWTALLNESREQLPSLVRVRVDAPRARPEHALVRRVTVVDDPIKQEIEDGRSFKVTLPVRRKPSLLPADITRWCPKVVVPPWTIDAGDDRRTLDFTTIGEIKPLPAEPLARFAEDD